MAFDATKPAYGTQAKSEEIRDNFQALVIQHRATTAPVGAEEGWIWWDASDPANERLRAYYDGEWKILFNHMESTPVPETSEAADEVAVDDSSWAGPPNDVFSTGDNNAQLCFDRVNDIFQNDYTITGSWTFDALSVTGDITVGGTVDGVDIAALSSDVAGFPDELKNLATAEIQQLETIGATTISATQWGYLGALDQSLTQASSPTFAGVTVGAGTLTVGVTTPLVAQWGYLGAMDQGVATGDSVSFTSITDGTATLTAGAITGLTAVNSVTATELSQLETMGATTISAAQWGYVGAMDQALATTDSPTFATITGTTFTDGTFSTTAGAFTGVASIATPSSITMAEDGWIGIGAADTSLIFDGTATQIEVTGADLMLGGAKRIYFEELGTTKGTESIYSAAGGYLDVLGGTAVRIASPITYMSGSVGIGTTTPDGKLHVDSSVSAAVMFQVTRENTLDGLRLLNYNGDTSTFDVQFSNDLSAWTSLMKFSQAGRVEFASTSVYGDANRIYFEASGVTPGTESIYSPSNGNLSILADTAITLDSDVIISDTNGLTLSDTTAAGDGVIYKGSDRFAHNFHHPTGNTAIPTGQNTFIGENAGNFTMGSTATATIHGSYNTGVGVDALYTNSTGYVNSAFGQGALYTNSDGYSNSAFGRNALYTNSSGHSNSAFGQSALYTNSSGHSNSAFGQSALTSNSTGYYNSALGRKAGQFYGSGTDANQTSYESVYLGASTRASADGMQDEIVIGYNAIGQGAHTAVLGHTTIVDSYIRGNLHVGQGAAGVDYTLTFDGENNDGVLTWMEDEALFAFDHGAAIGDGGTTNYAAFAADGELTLHGTARVKRIDLLANANLGKGATGMTEVILGNYTAWEADIGDDAVISTALPKDWAVGTDILIEVCWYVNEAYATANAEVRWQGSWSATPHDGTEAADAPTHSDTGDSGDINVAATAKGILENDVVTIPGASLAVGDELGITLERIALNAGVNPTGGKPSVMHLYLQYTAGSLGEAT